MTAVADKVAEIVAPALESMGYELVRVQHSGGRHPTLQIMAERRDESGMTVEDCTRISHAVSAILDVEDPIEGAYNLEVSSPGIDRPLVRPKDFERFAGFEAKLETRSPLAGRRKFKGELLGLDGDKVCMAVRDGADITRVSIPVADIAKAKLILTDALLASASGGPAPASGAKAGGKTN